MAALGEDRYPILEFDPDLRALIEPSVHLCAPSPEEVDMPARAVMCFFGDVVGQVARVRGAVQVAQLYSEHGVHPVFELEHEGERIAFFQPGVGAPLASLFLEEVIDYGCRAFVACGGAGALDDSLALGHLVVVSAAVRDEGTSYHYLAPSRLIEAAPVAVSVIETVLARSGVRFTTGITWSTDALYRETRGKLALRRSEGCITVEMEAAALAAVARFRGVLLGHLLYAGDSLAGEAWDHRDWVQAHDARQSLFWLAMDAAAQMPLKS
ncbi:MAG: nucleoside phosphorylase [Acidimicrobiales bacterium]